MQVAGAYKSSFHGHEDGYPRMGRGTDFSYPGPQSNGANGDVPPDHDEANYMNIFKLPIYAPRNPEDLPRYTTGQIYFLEKRKGAAAQIVHPLSQMCDLLRSQAENRAITRKQLARIEGETEVQRQNRITQAEYGASLESFLENFTIWGVGNGSPSPYSSNGRLAVHQSHFTASTLTLPACRNGVTLFPSALFGGPVKTGQKLFMIVKEVDFDPTKPYVNAHGDTRPSFNMGAGDSYVDIQFYSCATNEVPKFFSKLDFLGSPTLEQPSRSTPFYWKKLANGNKALRRAAVWYIGSAVDSHEFAEVDDITKLSRFKDVTTSKQINVALQIQRIMW